MLVLLSRHIGTAPQQALGSRDQLQQSTRITLCLELIELLVNQADAESAKCERPPCAPLRRELDTGLENGDLRLETAPASEGDLTG